MAIRIGVDVGGTFTDFVLLDEERRLIHLGKCLTTPADPSQGVLDGLADLLDRTGYRLAQLDNAVHGTTLVTNTIIERKGAKVGLLTTKGFRDAVEIGREFRYDIYDLMMERPQPLVPRYLRREVSERISANGEVLRELDVSDLPPIVADFRAEGVTAVAISLLHSYANPVHERAVAQAVRELMPEAAVTVSVDLAPEIREYERTSTACANAYVQPLVRTYLNALESELHERGMNGPLYLMHSNGGLATVAASANAPIRLLESGPAGGAMAARFYGEITGELNLISFDMGGTTAKMCLIDDGEPTFVHEFESARIHRFKKGSGLPVKVPVIEMIEIGAGGGSIARLDQMGLLKVGPESAGASPGPACYGLGGTEPTVTDADVVLGYLDPGFFLGGRMQLDRGAAEKAIGEGVGRGLGRDAVTAAVGIHELVNENMATATRLHVAERGRDLRKYALIAFGGAGPVHAYRVAELLRLKRLICPLGAGTTSALGFLVAPMTVDYVQSHVSRLDRLDWAQLTALYDEMERTARAALGELGLAPEQITISRSAEMRYSGQGYEISVVLPDGALDASRTDDFVEAFYTAYRKLFDRALAGIPVEALSWRLVASGPRPVIALRFAESELRATTEHGKQPLKGRRPVYFHASGGFVDADVYDRYALLPGATVSGPAVFEERESTAIVGPGATARIDEHLNLIVDLP
ncbi:MAG: hydantoinase/oxoprolinase family protein [Chloroflexi bacterium]|nr:hydantoinase/oxoprolinase family protein [Chloroflexota bacterium]